MASRERPRDRAHEAADRVAAEIGTQVRIARRNAGLSLRAAAGEVGLGYTTFGRIERHELDNVSVRQLALSCAAVGLELGARAFPAGDPARDAAQLKLLGRFRSRLPPAAPWATEVPMPIPGDLRGLDGWTRLQGVTIGVEAETRPRDLQAVARKAMLKKRDAGLDRIVLLIAESRANRDMLRLHRDDLRATFPLDSRAILAALAKGEPAGGGRDRRRVAARHSGARHSGARGSGARGSGARGSGARGSGARGSGARRSGARVAARAPRNN